MSRIAEQSSDACMPGTYEGEYECVVTRRGLPYPLWGRGALSLERDEETIQTCEPGIEFCTDLVIAGNSGTLGGQAAALFAFVAELAGWLDCGTGEFRAAAVEGRWAMPDLGKDPNEPSSAIDPEIGVSDGTLSSTVMKAAGETIGGTRDLYDHDNSPRCMGPCRVTLQR